MTMRIARISRDRSGLAALEFAMILPLLVVILFGSFEVFGLMIADMKIVAAADATADLIAQQNNVTTASVNDIITATQLTVEPLPLAQLGVAIASVTFDSTTGNPSLSWTQSSGNGAIANPVALATGLGSKGESVIIVRVNYAYQSPLKLFLPITINLAELSFARPRLVSTIVHN
ncbi:MAG TPA: TadE/TadG family type IV pilus assembly protein [Candidatus Cybelea sp.]|nr:TadE/TadG family type IV pilus assembly protein [Candidatus Cybelea sp.]